MLDVLILPDLRREEQPAGILLRSGGSAANTAAWLAHMGHSATFVGCVGRDAIGTSLVQELVDTGVRAAVRVDAHLETGCVAVQVDPDGERIMRSSRGANMALAPADILNARVAGPLAVHLTGYALLGPFDFDMLRTASAVAREAGALLSFDPSSVGVIERFGRERMLTEIDRCGVDLLLPNRQEAEALTGADDAVQAASMLHEIVPAVAIKDGPNGAVYCGSGAPRRISTVALIPVDTTGAGDAFNAGVLAGSIDDLEVAAERGHRAARSVIMQYGARPSLRTADSNR